MKTEIQPSEKDNLIDEILNTLVKCNVALHQCIVDEDYEQASIVKTALELFIYNSAFELAYKLNGRFQVLYEGIRLNSDLILSSLQNK